MSSSHGQSLWKPVVTFTVLLPPIEQYSMAEKGSEGGYWALHDPNTYASCKNQQERQEAEQCLACGNPSTRKYRCHCKAARYCSAQCLEADDLHERLCVGRQDAKTKPAFSLPLESRPSNNHFLAALLPVDGSNPKPIWISLQMDRKTGKMRFATDEITIAKAAAKSNDSSDPDIIHVGLNSIATPIQKSLLHGVDAIKFGSYKDTSPGNLNSCIQSFGKPGFLACYFGAVVVWAYDLESNGAFKSPRDLGVRDLRHALDCHVLNSVNPAVSQPSRFILEGGVIPALKINDLSDRWLEALGVTRQIEKVHVPASHQYFEAFPIGKLFHLGLRWYVRTGVPIAIAPTGELHENHEEILNHFRQTVLLVCGKQIEPAHLTAVIEYFKLASASGTPTTEKAFRAYWDYFKKNEVIKGHPMAGIPSPYDLENGHSHDPNSAGLVTLLQGYKSYEDFVGQAPVANEHVDGGLNAPKGEVSVASSTQGIEQALGFPAERN
ncbi:uncharacterized protein CLUP02_06742 [Colletotrichum lupini]|uniref:MYND-type domain-containing protein n=1 Tax=Colletotrichum lupini TaxID=145971 RepID=A0A9Q8SPT6_9PEZI|nr:uncharacterized protein CLUP02_06742 [Colletotrichum lupini]UQC81256.1 hypothetical protein CLUP02_06742 [Colletotrichum lupini]